VRGAGGVFSLFSAVGFVRACVCVYACVTWGRVFFCVFW
jgi:hypothetical protein